MNGWLLVDENTPHGDEILLWLKADFGMEKPIGAIIGCYQKTDHWEGFCEKSVSGSINLGLRQDLITHWKPVGDGPAKQETF